MLWSNYLQGTLAQKALGRASYDERKHPRHPKGTKGGGKFAPKGGGALAATVGQVRFNPKQVETDLSDDPLHSAMFERAGSVMVLFNPKTQELLFGIGNLNLDNGATRPIYFVHSEILSAVKPQVLGDDDAAVARRMEGKIDNWVRGTFLRAPTGDWGLELNTSYAAGTRFDRATNRWEEHTDESMLNISDALAALRAKGFPKDMIVEIWKGVPGRRGFGNIKTTLAEKAFDPQEHPRQPAGSDKGGQFAPKGGVLGGGAPAGNIEFTNDSDVAERARQRGYMSAALIFRPSSGALIADDRVEHADLVSEDGGAYDEYVRGRAMYARGVGWMFDFDFDLAGAAIYDSVLSGRWEVDNELASANIAATMRRLVEAGFPLDSKVRIQRAENTDVVHLTLADLASKSFLRGETMAAWNFPLTGLLHKASARAGNTMNRNTRVNLVRLKKPARKIKADDVKRENATCFPLSFPPPKGGCRI